MTDPCIGCQSITCDYRHYADICPCIKCLVKPTCMTTCNPLRLFVDDCQKQRTKEIMEGSIYDSMY